MRCINYADLAGLITAAILNLVNMRFFLQAFFRRMERLAGGTDCRGLSLAGRLPGDALREGE